MATRHYSEFRALRNAKKDGKIVRFNLDVLQYLVDQGADVNAKDNMGRTPLHDKAAYDADFDMMKCLVENGADVNAKTDKNATPLHFAADNGYHSSIHFLGLLIENGADVNVKTSDGRIPLDVAFTEEKKEILRNAGGKRAAELMLENRRE